MRTIIQCKSCGFEFSESLALCPRCAEPWECADIPEASGQSEDPAKILDAMGEKLGGIASSVKKYALEAGESLGGAASSVRKYAGEAGESIGDFAGQVKKSLDEKGWFHRFKRSVTLPRMLIVLGFITVILLLWAILFTNPGASSQRLPVRGLRGNISASDNGATYIFDILNFKKGDVNTLYIITHGGSKIKELDVPIVADVKMGVFVYGDKIYYKDASENLPEHPYYVYDLRAGKNYILFDEGEGVVSFSGDDAGVYAHKADGSFVMLPHGK